MVMGWWWGIEESPAKSEFSPALPQAPSPSVITRTQADTFGQHRTVLDCDGGRATHYWLREVYERQIDRGERRTIQVSGKEESPVSKTISHVSPHQTALTAAVLWTVMSIFFIVPMFLIGLLGGQPTNQEGEPVARTFFLGFLIALPVFYLVFGYLSTALLALLYNRISKFTGGIQFELSD